MTIYAIGDLHLSGQPPQKPMSVFDPIWENHWEKIKTSWQEKVETDDLVLICGDTSWAMSFTDALCDLNAIAELPGRKVFIRGNHDFWWSGVLKMQGILPNCSFLQNNFSAYDKWAICGGRGWLTPSDEKFTTEDEKIYRRELGRIERSLSMSTEAGFNKIILALHYPPLYIDRQPTGFSELCEKYQVTQCVYGHLHASSIALGCQGEKDGTFYSLVSADASNFQLKKIV